MKFLRKTLQFLLLIPIYLYRGLLSPYLGASCRYYPTCSSYMIESITKLGPIKGLIMGTARILRCNRRYTGGYDPVPDEFSLERIREDRKKFRLSR